MHYVLIHLIFHLSEPQQKVLHNEELIIFTLA